MLLFMLQVLWRYTGDVPEDVPKNVKLLKWIPQNDLLGGLFYLKCPLCLVYGQTET